MVATTLLAGVMVLSRPPSLFPAVPAAANDSVHTDHHILHDHGEANDGGYDLVGVLAALAVLVFLVVLVSIIFLVSKVS